MDDLQQLTSLPELGILRVRGADALRFLQGQLSSDLNQLSAERSQLSAYHSPQGRVIALVRLVALSSQDVVGVMQRAMVAPVSARLGRYVLRSKVKISDDSANWTIKGLLPAAADGAPSADSTLPEHAPEEWRALLNAGRSLPDSPNAQQLLGTCVLVRIATHPARVLILDPARIEALRPADANAGIPDRSASWRALDVAAGIPQVEPATSEEFVAQMLNLDVLGAIAFDKGCYTGQEVIARAHYRGRVKRRMQRFISRGRCALSAGATGQLEDGRAFKVVTTYQLPDGRCDFLAVTTVPAQAGSSTAIEAPATGAAEGASETAPGAALVVAADPAPLPYGLPE